NAPQKARGFSMRLMTLSIFTVNLCFAAFSGQPNDTVPGVYKDNIFTEFFRRTSGWTAGDGALSVPLSDGRVLWLFGDSHLDDIDPSNGTMPCLFQTRNAGLIHQKNELNNAHTLAGQGPLFRSWLKNSPDETKEWFWPECGFQNQATIWIYLAALRKTDAAGAFGFESTGHDFWAKIKFPEIQPQEYVPLPDLNGINFGYGFVLEDPYV